MSLSALLSPSHMYGKIHSVRYIGGIKFASNIFCKFLTNFDSLLLLGSAIRWSPGLVNFVTALAYHFCIALPAGFTQPLDYLLAEPF